MPRDFFPGMGQGVADRTVARLVMTENEADHWIARTSITLNPNDPDFNIWFSAIVLSLPLCTITEDDTAEHMGRKPELRRETWADVAARVAEGNTSLDQHLSYEEFLDLERHIAEGTILMSGRHLQHGDLRQAERPMEVFTNCSTAMFRSLLFKLLLSGSGVGSAYDDDLMLVDWTQQANVVCVIDWLHPDVLAGHIQGYLTPREALHLYADDEIIHHKVKDSREGWAEAVEVMEVLAFQKRSDVVLLLDFSDVRGKGAPIRGMQNRPASGPGPLMGAIAAVGRLRGTKMAPWKAAIFADHYLAECVLVGGARRAARIATKYWRDTTIFDFIDLKRPAELRNAATWDEVDALAAAGGLMSFLWSSNNSVAVDQAFYDALAEAEAAIAAGEQPVGDALHAWKVNEAVLRRQYHDRTGETGFLNVHRLDVNTDGLEIYLEEAFARGTGPELQEMMKTLAEVVLRHPYQFIVNPCGEIALFILGAFCVIGDLALFHAASAEDEELATAAITRALIRTNTMPSIYDLEVKRTNRIGVSLTGIFEWAWKRFGLGFRDLLEADEDAILIPDANGNPILAPSPKAMPFWLRLKELADIVDEESESYSALLGLVAPHTRRTIKPAGTTSKLFGLTEGAHLPPLREYLRWVQFRSDDPLVAEYAAKGYPTRELKSYQGTTIVGFPTAPVICTLGMGDKLVTAGEATPAEQFRWLRLLETFWIGAEHGNQISYTLKYKPELVPFDAYAAIMRENIDKVRAVSVLPQVDVLSYEYQPEEPLTKAQFELHVAAITEEMKEDIDKVHIDCSSGACPVDFDEDEDEKVAA